MLDVLFKHLLGLGRVMLTQKTNWFTEKEGVYILTRGCQLTACSLSTVCQTIYPIDAGIRSENIADLHALLEGITPKKQNLKGRRI